MIAGVIKKRRHQTLVTVPFISTSAGAGGGGGGAGLPISLRYLDHGVKKGVGRESEDKWIVPPHGEHADELGDSGRNKNDASDLGVFVHDIRQRSQAFGLVGKRVFDGFEVVSCDSDGNGGDNCTPVTRQQIEK
jgi:hypothetical protein